MYRILTDGQIASKKEMWMAKCICKNVLSNMYGKMYGIYGTSIKRNVSLTPSGSTRRTGSRRARGSRGCERLEIVYMITIIQYNVIVYNII